MTNFEYYKETIIKITNEGKSIALVNDKPIACESLEYCTECQLKNTYDNCDKPRTQWFCKEHIEQPKLTKKERQFCELVETGWICRDCHDDNNDLWWFVSKPKRSLQFNEWESEDNFHYLNHMPCKFSFITCDDAEPWSIEDLLKLEVEE